jgi:alginate O-acetyltransferase complex protein AlgI
MSSLLSLALWLAGVGHFCILAASLQVPARLQWSRDLAQLLPFNRKLMWTYGGFTVFTIVAFGAMTLGLHDDFIHGDRAALALAAFIAVYWTARVAVDGFYFSHRDWPSGVPYVLGHVMLTGLFIALALTYYGVIAWHFMGA